MSEVSQAQWTLPLVRLKQNKFILPGFDLDIKKAFPWNFNLNLGHTTPLFIEFEPVDPGDEVEVRYGLTTFLFFGREITKKNRKSRRDTIRFRVDKFDIALVQVSDYRALERQLREKKDINVTSEMIMKTSYENISAVDEVANDIRWLLCLASGNYVTDLYQDLCKEGKLARTILKPLKTYPFTSRRSAIDTTISGNGDLETFLRISYPEFVKYKDEDGYICHSKTTRQLVFLRLFAFLSQSCHFWVVVPVLACWEHVHQ